MTTAAALVTRHPALRHTGTSRMHLPTLQKAGEILDDLETKRGKTLAHVWGYDPNTGNTEHHSGRALDFMVHSDRAAGDHIANYVIANKERLGLIHIIWRQRIYRGPRSTSKNPKGAWYKMADRGDPTQNHMDHPHVWFAATGYTPAVEPTTLSSYLTRGSTGPEVRLLQKMLNGMDGAGLSLDGSFGPAVQTAVRSAQSKRSLTVDGQVGPKTRTRLNADWKAHNSPTTTTTTTTQAATTTTTTPVTTTTTTAEPVTTTTTTTEPTLEVVRGLIRQELSLVLLGAIDHLKEKP